MSGANFPQAQLYAWQKAAEESPESTIGAMLPDLFRMLFVASGSPLSAAILDKAKKGELSPMDYWRANALFSAVTGDHRQEVANLVGLILGQPPLTVPEEKDYDYVGREKSQKAYDRKQLRRQKRFDLLARIAEEKKRKAEQEELEKKMKRVREEARK
jgi:hypothetical protein